MNNQKTREAIADRILELLDQGGLPPWERPWRTSDVGEPRNAISMKPYRGINHWLTLITHTVQNYKDPRWLTYRQAQTLDGNVRKGEESTRIVFWKKVNRRQGDEQDMNEVQELNLKQETYLVARFYNVFNVEQTHGCRLKPLPEPGEMPGAIEQAEAIIQNMPNRPEFDTFEHINQPPHYIPGADQVRVPSRDRYQVPEQWYNSVFHELTHATGHPTRLARFEAQAEQDSLHRYGVEELVAGMGAAILSGQANMERETIQQDAAYIKHWRDAIAADKSIVLQAAGKAQRAADYILGEQAPQKDTPEDPSTNEEEQ